MLCYHPLGDDYDCERGKAVEVIESVAAKGPLGTIDFAKKIQKPFIHISKRAGDYTDPAQRLQGLLRRIGSTLNVAGSRESKEPSLHRWVMQVLEEAFFRDRTHPGILGDNG